jgi:hypothetical protein
MQEEFGDKGLVVMALSNEEDAKVEPYIDQHGLQSIVVAAGSKSSSDYGVRGIPHSVLIDPDGNVAWSGHPGSLSSGKVKKLLKGAKARSKDAFLSVKSALDSASLSSAIEAAHAGKLGKALSNARTLAANPAATDAEKQDADTLIGEIESHVAFLRKQASQFVERRDMLKAVLVLDSLADDLKDLELGSEAAKAKQAILDDDTLKRELDAAEALARADDAAAKRGRKKAAKKYEGVAEDFKGTKAADRARMVLRNL